MELVYLNHVIRTNRYKKRTPHYSAYTKPAGRTKNNNWQSVLAKKIILQSVVCIAIIFLITWLQGQTEEPLADITSQIRLRVIEKNIAPDDIYESIANTYEECTQYLQSVN